MIKRMLHVMLAAFLLYVPYAIAGGKTTHIFTDESGIAIKGYDTVAFFVDGKPAKGSSEFKAEWSGATWYFTSAEHRDLFVASPEKYAPQYGGWCAYGAASGYAAKTEPDQAWTVRDGKLYLNWDAEVSATWKQDIPGYLQKSEANWEKIKAGLFDGTTEIYLK